ncbi:MAG: hypothetical protein AB9Q22_10245 [Candidatus Reddybacter sp.]
MAFQTGTFSSFSDLKTKLETFLTGNGYTLTTGIITKSGTQIHLKFASTTDDITLEMGKDSSAGALLHKHPVMDGTTTQLVGMGTLYNKINVPASIVFPANYDFQLWASPVNEFRCVIEYNNEYTQNLGFAEIVKAVDMDGGVVIDASGCYVRATSDIGTAKMLSLTSERSSTDSFSLYRAASSPMPFGYGRTNVTDSTASTQLWAEFMGFDWWLSGDVNGLGATLAGTKYARSSNTFFTPLRTSPHSSKELEDSLQVYNANAAMAPIRLYGHHPGDNYAPLGSVQNIRWLNIKHLNFGEVVDDGVDKWKCYPAYFKDASALNGTALHSGQWGFAVRYDGP